MEDSRRLALHDIWCVIPVYNNKGTVREIAAECRAQIPQVVIVDDGSTDADVEALFSGTDIAVLKHRENRGKGEAIRTALKYVEERGGRFMVTIDADGQHYPRDLEKLIPLLQDDEAAIVIGCRKFEGEKVPRASAVGRKIANFWLRLEAGVSIDDCQSGFRAYPVEYLSKLRLVGSHFDFESEVLARAVWAGLKLKTVEIEVWYPDPGLRVSSFRPIVDNLRLSWMHARLVGRRLLPFPHRRLVASGGSDLDARALRHPIEMLKKLLKEDSTPGLLGVSAGVGTFLAVLPLVSVHTLVILYVATRLRLNRLMAVSIQNLCMPPFVPMVCIELGYRMRYGRWLTDFSTKVVFGELHHRLFEWLLGSLLVAPIGAVLVGGVVFLGAWAVQVGIESQRGRVRT